MSNKKLLFDGCSFTANSGFRLENQTNAHWPYLLSRHYQRQFDNNAIGGSSNEEIFNRVVCATASNSYDLVLVQWSELSRVWIYCATENIDDFTIINGNNPLGYRADMPEVRQYAKLYYTYFNNVYVNLKKWLCQILALAGYFVSKNQPYIFIKGFENYISEFNNINYNEGFENLNSTVKHFLDFDNRPDDYLLKKIKHIQILLYEVQKLHWLNFDLLSFFDSTIDFADDRCHPGPDSNRLLTDQLISYCDKHYPLVHD
jgi:hypothetical protein